MTVETPLADGFVDIPESLVKLAETRIRTGQTPGWRYLTITEFNDLAVQKVKKHLPGQHDQKSHGNWSIGFHGTTDVMAGDIMAEGFDLSLAGHTMGSLWGEGAYLAASQEEANKWANLSRFHGSDEYGGSAMVLRVEVPDDANIFLLKFGSGQSIALFNEKARQRFLEDLTQSGNPQETLDIMKETWERWDASAISSVPGDRTSPTVTVGSVLQQVLTDRDWDGLEINPDVDSSGPLRISYVPQGGHQLILWNPDVVSRLKVTPALLAKGRVWYTIGRKEIRKHYGPGDHASGSSQKVHGSGGGGKDVSSASGKRKGKMTDLNPATALTGAELRATDGAMEQSGRDIFEGTLTLPGSDEQFMAEVISTERITSEIAVVGQIMTAEGDFVGEFHRRFQDRTPTEVDNITFQIVEKYQGRGIGTMFLSHWEDELAAAGYTHMNVTTSDIGNYAWAISGYEFSGFQHELMEDAEGLVNVWKSQAESLGRAPPMQLMAAFESDTKSWETLQIWTEEWRDILLYPTPLTLATIGADRPQGDTHFGKELMLTLGSWNGRKDITIKKSLGPARAVWKRWAQNNPKAIETDDSVFLNELFSAVRVIQVEKHLPGQHNQKTHGRRNTGVTSATGKLSGVITDLFPVKEDLTGGSYGLNKPGVAGNDIFEATLELPDGTKIAAEVRRVTDMGVKTKVFGIFITDDGVQIGGFTRIFMPGLGVYNAELKLSEDFQGRGIGTMFLSHWEDELVAAGFERMTVSSVDVGRYAWAVSGYDWRGEQANWKEAAQRVFARHESGTSSMATIFSRYEGEAKSWSTLKTLLDDWDAGQPPTPLDFALIGSDRPGAGNHFGKDLFLQGPPWSGEKKLLAKSLAAAREVWKRWATSDPAAVEADDPEFLAEMSSAVEVQKHLPGQHDQKSHGNWARGKADNLKRIMRQFADFMSGRQAEGVLSGNTGLGVSASLEEIVLKHGRAYTAPTDNASNQALMKEFDVTQGELKDCYMNCAREVVMEDVDLTYVEGYALPASVPMPIHHAWMVTDDGRVIDNTWGQEGVDPGTEYYGIPFNRTWLTARMLETKVWGVFQGRRVEDIEDAIA